MVVVKLQTFKPQANNIIARRTGDVFVKNEKLRNDAMNQKAEATEQ